jgi:hypothetical protein
MTTRTRTPRTRKTTAKVTAEVAGTVVPQPIPADMMGVGFVAVPIRFPDVATAHRIAHVTIHRDDAAPNVEWSGDVPIRHETRAACQAAADVADKVYELSAPMAHHRGALGCTDPACFGTAEARRAD